MTLFRPAAAEGGDEVEEDDEEEDASASCPCPALSSPLAISGAAFAWLEAMAAPRLLGSWAAEK